MGAASHRPTLWTCHEAFGLDNKSSGGTFFAVERDEKFPGAVYAYMLRHREIDQTISPKVQDVEGVAIVRPRPFDRRFLHQSALFTYHSSPTEPLQPARVSLFPEDPNQAVELNVSYMAMLNTGAASAGVDLIEFVIPDGKFYVRKELATLGITRETLFPDLEGLSQHLNETTKTVYSTFHRFKTLDQPGEH
jgi:hypothetical protein